MASDHSLAMRQAIVKKLRVNAALTSVVPPERIYGERSPSAPVWPFIRYGVPVVLPYAQSCGEGNEHSLVIHVFALGPATDVLYGIMDLVAKALDNADLDLAPLELISIDYTGSNPMRDTDQQDNWHGIVRFSAVTLETT